MLDLRSTHGTHERVINFRCYNPRRCRRVLWLADELHRIVLDQLFKFRRLEDGVEKRIDCLSRAISRDL